MKRNKTVLAFIIIIASFSSTIFAMKKNPQGKPKRQQIKPVRRRVPAKKPAAPVKKEQAKTKPAKPVERPKGKERVESIRPEGREKTNALRVLADEIFNLRAMVINALEPALDAGIIDGETADYIGKRVNEPAK